MHHRRGCPRRIAGHIDVDLREGDLLAPLPRVLVARPLRPGGVCADFRGVRLLGLDHVALQHGVVLPTHRDTVVGEDAGVVLDVLADLGTGSIRPKQRQRLVEQRLLRRVGAVMRQRMLKRPRAAAPMS